MAAVLTALAVLAGLSAVRAEPETRSVVIAARDLPSGHELRSDDLRSVRLPPDVVPDGGLPRAAATGHRLAGPVRRGEPLTDARLLRPSALAGYPEGSVLTTIEVAGPETTATVEVGEQVDVVAVDPAGEARPEVVARTAHVAALLEPDEGSSAAGVAATTQVALVTDRPAARRLLATTVTRHARLLVATD